MQKVQINTKGQTKHFIVLFPCNNWLYYIGYFITEFIWLPRSMKITYKL